MSDMSRFTSFVTFLFLHVIIASAQQDIIEEDPDCPCLGSEAHQFTSKSGNGTCLDARVVTNSSGIQSTHCYPIDYGMKCGFHAKNTPPFCDGDNPPGFCDQPFCFVDHNKCMHSEKSSFAKSRFFPHLYFSFSTCGAEDMVEESLGANNLNGITLRVGVPVISFPFHYKLEEDGEPIFFDTNTSKGVGEWTGIYIDHIREIARLANFDIEWHSVSPGAIKLRRGDAWTGCVTDVGRGLLDLCVAKFWETTERRKIATYTTTIFNDFFYVVVPRPEVDKSITAETGKLFQPFTNGLWITICLVTVLVGISYTLLASSRKTLLADIRANLLKSIYDAAFELLQGTDSSDKSVTLKVVTLSWAFFIMIIIAAYTANLAAFLSREQLLFNVRDIHDCVKKGCNMCSLADHTLEKTIMTKYPKLKLDAKYANPRELNTALFSGKCDAFLASEFDWSLYKEYFQDCKTTFTGEYAVFLQTGWPVADQYAKSMSYWLGKVTTIGDFERLDIVEKHRPIDTCPETFTRWKLEKLATQITVASMTGPLIILLAGIVGAFIVKFTRSVQKRSSRKQRVVRLRRDKRRQVRLMISDSDVCLAQKPTHFHED